MAIFFTITRPEAILEAHQLVRQRAAENAYITQEEALESVAGEHGFENWAALCEGSKPTKRRRLPREDELSIVELSPGRYRFQHPPCVESHEPAIMQAGKSGMKGDYDDVKETCDRIIAACPQHIQAWTMIAQAEMLEGDPERARNTLLAPLHDASFALPADFDWTGARLEYHEPQNRPFLDAYQLLGEIYYRQEDYRSARLIFQRLVTVGDPGPGRLFDPQRWLLATLFRLGRFEEALDLHDLFQAGERDVTMDFTWPLTLLASGRTAEGIFHLGHMVEDMRPVAAKLVRELYAERIPEAEEEDAHEPLPGVISAEVTTDQAEEYFELFGEFWGSRPETLGLIVHFLKHGPPESPDMEDSLAKTLDELGDEPTAEDVIALLRQRRGH